MVNIRTVKFKLFKKYILENGFKEARTKGSHTSFTKDGVSRPLIIRTKDKEIPITHIETNLDTMGKTKEDFLDWVDNNQGKKKKKKKKK